MEKLEGIYESIEKLKLDICGIMDSLPADQMSEYRDLFHAVGHLETTRKIIKGLMISKGYCRGEA